MNAMNKSTFDKYTAYARAYTGCGHDYYFDGYIAGLNVYYARIKKLKTLEKHEQELQRVRDVYQSVESGDGTLDGIAGKRPPGMPSGHEGNTNAAKREKFDSNVVVACTSSDKAKWVKYAERKGYKSLGALVRDRMKECS